MERELNQDQSYTIFYHDSASRPDGRTPDLAITAVTSTAMYTGSEGLYACCQALDDPLEDWK